MDLMSDDIKQRLLENGRNRDEDHVPVVKFFNPAGAATWLITEMDEDEDTMFGLCDLGFGEPELGYVSLFELGTVRVPFGLGIERDLSFAPIRPLSIYYREARRARRIAEIG